MALSITDLRKGTIFQLDGEPYRVVEYSQKVMGRGGSTVNVKIKSLLDGQVLSKTFHGNETVDSAECRSRPVQYLYSDGGGITSWIRPATNSLNLDSEDMEDKAGYIKEGDNVTAQFFGGRHNKCRTAKKRHTQSRAYAEEAVRGDTSTAITKDARLETGITVKVPLSSKRVI